MPWSIEYYDANVEQAVLKLPPGLVARYLRLADLLLEFGPNLGMPHTLWERGWSNCESGDQRESPGHSTAP